MFMLIVSRIGDIMTEIIDGTCKFKIKDKRQHHCLGEIVALISTPPFMNICSNVMDRL